MALPPVTVATAAAIVSTPDALPEIEARARPLQDHFERFFPQLALFAASERLRLDAVEPR